MVRDTNGNAAPEETTDDRSEITALKQRISNLEERNKVIEEELRSESRSARMTRRSALGVLGGGALLGTAGSTSAREGVNDEDSGNPPWAPDEHDHSGEYGTPNQLGQAAPVESVTAHTFHDVPYIQKEEKSGISDRDIVSGRPIQIWVDPNGDDDGGGTEDDPVASLQEALNRLPYILTHPVDIVLTSGTVDDPTVHDTGVGVMSGMHMSIYHAYEEGDTYFEGATGMNVAIRSESGNPEDTILGADYYLSFYFVGNSVLNVGFKDLTIDGGIENYGGVFGAIDCVLKGSPRTGQLFAGYAGNTFATRCEITAPVVTSNSAGAVVGLNSCTVDPPEGETDWNGNRGVLSQYQAGATVFAKGGDINVPWFGDGAIGYVVTLDNIYHPAAPDGIIDN
ncbi:hypothetical protein [Saliphagus sp. LR7]|uniref:hypothetical protein n=1 Tax=Saliphagus sp. LR7 TaxID=2282654 RepID=UPI000DF78C24|nr:hypothetical protein [Saliphagus sp. LR7]